MPTPTIMIVGEDHAVTQYYHDAVRSHGLQTLHVHPPQLAPALYYRTLPNLIWLDSDGEFFQNAHLLSFLDTLPPGCQPQIILSASPTVLQTDSLAPHRHLIGGVFQKPVRVLEVVPLVVDLARQHAEQPPCGYYVTYPLAANESVYFLQLWGVMGAEQLSELGAVLATARGLICDLRGLARVALPDAIEGLALLPRVESALVVHHPDDAALARRLAARCPNAVHYWFHDISPALDFASTLY